MFDAVIAAASPHANTWVSGLTLRERGRKIAERLGARRVFVLDGEEALGRLPAWWGAEDPAALVVIRAGDQLVHNDLLAPLLESGAERALAVTPTGEYAGALLAGESAAAETLAALTLDDRELARAWADRDDVTRVEHGEVARHPVTDESERRRAGKYLRQIIFKSQDGPVTRWLYRPVSVPITRLLLHTPITPNQVSLVVAVLGALGVILTASYDYNRVILGSGLVLLAGYLDGCDGEIARLKLKSSRLGAWIDTITDEFTTVGFMIAIGYHNYLRHPEPWVFGTIVFVAITSLLTIYAIYYYLIVVAGSANSQDYVDKLEVVPGHEPGTLALRPAVKAPGIVARWPRWMQEVAYFFPHMVRRDFINWGSFALALVHWNFVSYGMMVTGAAISVFLIFCLEHPRLRRQVAEIRRGNNAAES